LQIQGESASAAVAATGQPRYSGVVGTIGTIAKHEGFK
jgi:hypothetical protein